MQKELVSYFIYEFAPSRSDKNHLEAFEGFIYDGPEYLTMFGGGGKELETIDFPVPRGDDGLMWGDYAMRRIEPCQPCRSFLIWRCILRWRASVRNHMQRLLHKKYCDSL